MKYLLGIISDNGKLHEVHDSFRSACDSYRDKEGLSNLDKAKIRAYLEDNKCVQSNGWIYCVILANGFIAPTNYIKENK